MRAAAVVAIAVLSLACSKDDSGKDKKLPPPVAPAADPGKAPPAPAPAPPAAARPPAPAPEGRMSLGGIHVKVPEGWTSSPPTSNMRAAQFSLPPAEGDAEPAELVVYYFGPGGAGGVQANLDRWYGQFQQPDGKPSKEVAKVHNSEVAGMPVTSVDVSGRYVAAMTPGAPGAHDKPGFRMLAAIVEAPDGAYYFKLVGPEKTVAAHAEAFAAMVADIHK